MSKIIFTDCFNTIILRKESDKIVTYNWCEKLGEKYDIEPAVIYHFVSKYKFSLAIKNFFKIGDTEINFEKVIAEVANVLKKNISDFDVCAFKKDAIATYIEVESFSHYLNKKFVEKLKLFKAQGAKIYVLSDFYCGKEVLKIWFKNLGVADLFDDIFVSCDYMATKRSTRLYKKIVRQLNIRKKDITMFGDNRHADILCSKLVGIKSFRVQTEIKKAPKDFKKIIQFGSHYKKYAEIFERFGNNYNYSNHAFSLFLFIRRLYNELKKSDVKNVFFLSREGLFLKTLFDKYSEMRGGIKSHYLEVSRNALYRVVLKPLEEEDFTYFFKKIHKIDIYKFLNSLSFSEQEIEEVQAELKVNIKIKKRNLEKTETFKNLKNCFAFKKIYEAKRKEQEGVFDKYLKSFGVDFSKEGMNIVDVGWRGSMQDLLTTYLGPNIDVKGWYIGYLKIAFTRNFIDINQKSKKGLLFDMRKNKHLGNKCFEPMFLDYEQICRANRGSVYGYKINNDKVSVIYENKIDESKLHKKYILPLQDQIENKFSDLCKLEFKNLSIIEPITVLRHMDIYKKLSRNDINFYLNAINSHFDNFIAIGIPKGSNTLKRFAFNVAGFLLKIRYLRFSKKRIFKTFYKQIAEGKLYDL
ncbi:MAG: HAD family hydrolase [Clostridia bacterium]|nr:HAD family hydrolase [Clostridia bacterium]